MAANSIGNASLVLSSSGEGLASGLTKAAMGIKSWSDKAQANIAGAVTGIGAKVVGGLSNAKALFAGVGAAIGTCLGGPIGTAIGGAVGEAAGGIIEHIFSAVTKPFDNLNLFGKLNRQASTLGVSASQFQGFTHILERFGIEGDAATGIFAKMGRNITKIGQSKEGLGTLQQMGISLEELQNIPLDQQFKVLADGINKLPRGAEQAAAAMNLFGKAGFELLPILQKGSEGIDELVKEGVASGAILSDAQLQAAGAAAKAWKDAKRSISETWEGLANRATMIAAPIVTFFAGIIQKGFKLMVPVFEWLGRAIEKTAIIFDAIFKVLGGWIDDAMKWVGDLVSQVFSFGNSWMSIEDVIFNVLKGVSQAIGYVWDTLKAGAGIISWVAGVIILGFGKIITTFQGTIRDVLNTAGKLPDALGGKMFRDAAVSIGIVGAGVEQVGNNMADWGKKQMDAFGESPKKIGEWFDNIKDKTRDAAKQADMVAEHANAIQPYKGIDAALKGSKEAYNIESKFRFENTNSKKVEEKQLDVMKSMKTVLDNISNKVGLGTLLKAG